MGIGDPWRPAETRTYNASPSYYIEHLQPGVYTIEMYGGQGGNYIMGDGSYGSNHGGYGGHSKGTLRVYEDTDIYVYSGEKSIDFSISISSSVTSHYSNYGGGWHDIGPRYGQIKTVYYSAIGGGGSSEVRLRNNNLYTRLMVAGGGGGAAGSLPFESGYSAHGGNGGGDIGGNGDGGLYYSRATIHGLVYNGYGATLNAPGAGGNGSTASYSRYRNFIAEDGDTHGAGYGGSAYYKSIIEIYTPTYGAKGAPVGGGSGGGGFHGGGGGLYSLGDNNYLYGTSGGGGSGYIYTDALSSEDLPYYQYYPDCELNPETDYLIDYRNDDGIQEGLYTQQSTHTGDGVVTIKCQKLGIESRLMMWVKQDLTFVKAEKAWVKTDIAFNELQQLSVKVDNAFWPSK